MADSSVGQGSAAAVTESQGLEAQLLQANAELSSAMDAIEQGIVLLTTEFDIRVFNRAARRLLGYDADELIGLARAGQWETYREDGTVLPVDQRPVALALTAGQEVTGALVRWRQKSDGTILLRLTTRVIRSGSTITGVIIAISDVTAERAVEKDRAEHIAQLESLAADLSAAVALREQVLATVSHDMRNPLSAIVGFAELLGEIVDEGEREMMIAAIKRQARALHALTSDLLAVAAMEGGTLELQRETVSLSSTVVEIVADANVPGVHLQLGGPVLAYVDPFRLSQIVTNLLTNANRYGRPPIELAVRAEGEWATISVTDHGDGVPEGHVERLFERFRSAHQSTGRDDRGTGLGLFIVRALARAHGGDVTYEPTAAGATFVVRLPAGGSAEAATDPIEPPGPVVDVRPGERILVVDDDADRSSPLTAALEGAGFSVEVATDEASALVRAEGHAPDAVLARAELPGGGGLGLLRALRERPLIAHVPVLLVSSGRAGGAEVAAAFAAGATDFLRQPFETVELVARLRAALAMSTRARDLAHLSRSLDRASRTDPLTGLLNRRGLEAEMQRLAGPARRELSKASVLLLDLDNFKVINDAHGREAGDRALRVVGDVIAAELRDGDVVGRYGGEEFLALLSGAAAERAQSVGERLRMKVEQLAFDGDDGTRITTTVSVGVAEARRGDFVEALALADRRLHAGKAAGGNQVRATD